MNLFADLNFAKKLFNDGLIEESRTEFEKVINSSPASEDAATATYYIALGYIKQNDFQNAVKYLNKIIYGYKNYSRTDQVLLQIGKAYLNLNEYDRAINTLNRLFKTYPTSKYMKKALKPYANALYESQDYNNAIVVLDKLIKNYPNQSSIPYLYLIQAKAYYKDNIKPKSLEIAQKIIKKYPNSNERWEAELFLLKIKKISPKEYVEKLKSLLLKAPPRTYDEKISFLLAKKLFETNQLQKASEKLNYLVKKYENSNNLCKYIKFLMDINLKLGYAEKNISLFNKNKKKIPENRCKMRCKLLAAKSNLLLKNYNDTKALISNILKKTKNDTIIFDTYMLKSELLIATNHFVPAIKNYLECSEKFARLQNNNLLFFKIGMIYKQNLNDYQKAIKYFLKVQPYSIYYNDALYQISLCYENRKDYKKAISTLQEIDINSVKNGKQKENIKQKLDYLKNFKLQNYSKAFNNLLDATIKFNSDNDKKAYFSKLVSIYANDLKMYENALESVPQNQYYLKCKIILKLLKKSKYEGENIEKYKKLLEENLAFLKNDNQKYNEIALKEKIIISENEKPIKEIKKYISDYPDSPATDFFKSYVAEYYLSQNKIYLAKDYIISLKTKKEDFNYYKLKIALAEKFYKENNDSLALKLYKQALGKINLSKPIVMFHYLVTLYPKDRQTAISKLKFLVNNTDFFKDKQNIYLFLAKALSETGEYETAVNYLLQIPEKFRDDNFYKLLSSYYYQLKDYENAKIAIMHIKNKNTELLKQLADLQIKTDDKQMAIYTLKQLSSKVKNKTEIYEKLGKLYFDTNDYENAVKYLSKYERLSSKKDKDSILKLIISYLKIKNRPKADIIKKRYKKIFDSNDKNLLLLNYGIYYLDIDEKASIKKFKSIIKSKTVDKELKYKAYFWRGVALLKQKKTEEALNDFLKAKNTSDKTLLLNVHLKLGTLYFSKEDYENALKNYMFVVNNGEKSKLAYDAAKNFAMVCKTTKDFDRAIETYNIILQRWDNNPKIKAQTLFDIGFSYFRDKKFPKAIEYFNQAIDLITDEGTKAEAQYWIGESYLGEDNYEKAITEFLKVYYNYPNQTRWAASAQLKAAEAYIKSGGLKKAEKLLNRIISKYGKSSMWGKQAVEMKKNILR